MSVKALNFNQHIPLHGEYGKDNCCLCKAENENVELKKRLLAAENKRERAESLMKFWHKRLNENVNNWEECKKLTRNAALEECIYAVTHHTYECSRIATSVKELVEKLRSMREPEEAP